ncbi:hypothetical protein LCGC14_2594160, partial [marine sediment metagenome]
MYRRFYGIGPIILRLGAAEKSDNTELSPF